MTNDGLNTNLSQALNQTQSAQIEFLVESGLYDDAQDFMRVAVRKLLDEHKTDIARYLDTSSDPEKTRKHWIWSLGVQRISQEYVESIAQGNGKLSVRVLGVLKVDDDVDIDMLMRILTHCKVTGVIFARDEVRERLEAAVWN